MSLISDAQAENIGNPKKKVKVVKEPIKTKAESRKIESNPSKDIELSTREIILRFKMNL
jgi:hypothetical protein